MVVPYDERLGSMWEVFFAATYKAVKQVYSNWAALTNPHLVATKLYSDAITDAIGNLARNGVVIKLTSGGRPGSTSLKTYDNDMLRVLKNDLKGTAFAKNSEGDFVHGSKSKITKLGKDLAEANEKAATEEAYAAAGNIIPITDASEKKQSEEQPKGVETNAPVSVTVEVAASPLDGLSDALRGEVEGVIALLHAMASRSRTTKGGGFLDGEAEAVTHVQGLRKALVGELNGRFRKVTEAAIKSAASAA